MKMRNEKNFGFSQLLICNDANASNENATVIAVAINLVEVSIATKCKYLVIHSTFQYLVRFRSIVIQKIPYFFGIYFHNGFL